MNIIIILCLIFKLYFKRIICHIESSLIQISPLIIINWNNFVDFLNLFISSNILFRWDNISSFFYWTICHLPLLRNTGLFLIISCKWIRLNKRRFFILNKTILNKWIIIWKRIPNVILLIRNFLRNNRCIVGDNSSFSQGFFLHYIIQIY